MKVITHADADFAERLRELTAPSSLFDPLIEERTKAIIDGVKMRGDGALLEYIERFDGARLTVDGLKFTQAELLAASLTADDSLRAAVQFADKNIAQFARKSLRKSWSARNAQGATVGERFDPFQRVGIYIPAGAAPLTSTALMTITLARVAGCPEIVVCSPCGRDGGVDPALLFAARFAGATEIYKVGGAQAVAAMALGTPSVPRVQKIFGPGGAYVVMAKRLLFGYVAVDLLPGPSELLVLADDTASAKFAAADLLAQAEHGSGHERVWLVTISRAVQRAVEREIAAQLSELKHAEHVRRALDQNGWLIQVKSLDDAVKLANRLAPEHCEVMTRNAREVAGKILTAGAIFLGPWSPTVLGDYVAGPSHTLPTGGAGSSFAGLTVDQFQRRTSVVEYNRGSLKKSLAAVQKFAQAEGLEAHGKSAAIRTKS